MAKAANQMRNRWDAFLAWMDYRLPVSEFWQKHMAGYYAPKNFNFWYFFGSLALLLLVNQIVTGIWLTMNYKPSAQEAFGSVEYIMRDVDWGWLLRYMHTTGASAFFIVIYMHMFRGLLYGSHRRPRELIWIFGMLIYVLLMAEAFMGYVLPWGQMSYWGAQVIISLFGAIPGVGEGLATWIRGDYVVADATINRFFAFHVVALPLALLVLVILHLSALHQVGSNNPDGVEIKDHKDGEGKPLDGVRFHPYYTVKDLFGVGMFMIPFAFIIFYWPTAGGLFLEPDNFNPANPLQTPAHIKPVWYFTPFYAILRAIPNKLGGVSALASAILLLFLVPWLDRSPVKSFRYRGPIQKIALALFVVAFIGLGYIGSQPANATMKMWAQILAVVYFAFFLLMPIYTKLDSHKPVPERVTDK